MTPRTLERLAAGVMTRHFGVPLRPGQVGAVPKRFDLVSPDGRVVGDAKYYTLVGGQRLPPAKFSSASSAVRVGLFFKGGWAMSVYAGVGLFILGGLLGTGVGVAVAWFFFVQPKSKALAQLRSEFEKQQVRQEMEVEKLAWVEQAQVQMREAFEALASQSLRSNADELLTRSKSELSHLVDPLGEKLGTLDTHIRELEQRRQGAYEGLSQQLQQLGQAQRSLQETTTTLKEALRSSGTRGRWGELQLRRVVELSGMVGHVDFEEQVATGDGRPDLVVKLPNGGVVPVDAKAPMDAYLQAVSAADAETRKAKLDAHAQAVRSRVRQLSQKRYWAQFDRAPEFVVMFVPYESCLSAAFECDGSLLDYALESRILIASPVTLLAVLKAVGYGWQQVSIARNAQQIAEEGKVLYQRLSKVAEHIADLGASLDGSIAAYNSLIGSLEHRLLPSARRFEELGVDAEAMRSLDQLDRTTRKLTAEEMTEPQESISVPEVVSDYQDSPGEDLGELSAEAIVDEDRFQTLLDQCESNLEAEVLQAIRGRGLHLPDAAQVTITDGDVPLATADFAYEPKILVFIDGSPHYQDYVQASDQRKRTRLKALGYRVVVVKASEEEAGLDALEAKLG